LLFCLQFRLDGETFFRDHFAKHQNPQKRTYQ
jgi:hypothetical protein